MTDEIVAELIGDRFLKLFDLLVAELDHPTGLQVDQMIVVCARHFFVARAAFAEIVPGQDVTSSNSRTVR